MTDRKAVIKNADMTGEWPHPCDLLVLVLFGCYIITIMQSECDCTCYLIICE